MRMSSINGGPLKTTTMTTDPTCSRARNISRLKEFALAYSLSQCSTLYALDDQIVEF